MQASHDEHCSYLLVPCRLCRAKVTRSGVERHVETVCSNLEVQCPNVYNGCKQSCLRGGVPLHVKVCPFQQMVCNNSGCSASIIRRQQADHNLTCPYFEIQCTSCSLFVPRGRLRSHQNATCTGTLVSCPNYPCRLCLTRGELEEHEKVCPFKPTRCPHADCQMVVPRNQLDSHRNRCQDREVYCSQHCGSVYTQREEERHRSMCPGVVIACGHRGCYHRCRRADMSEHEEYCDQRPMHCPRCYKGMVLSMALHHIRSCPALTSASDHFLLESSSRYRNSLLRIANISEM